MFTKLINRFVKSPSALSDESLEDTWIDTKASLLVTCPYKQEQAYSSLYNRCNNLMRWGIARRHRHLVLDAEAKSPLYNYIVMAGGVLRRIDHQQPENVPSSMLPGLILVAYTGGSTKTTVGDVLSNPSFVIRAIDYLVDEKKLPLGLFLKGFVLKYGIELSLTPNIKAAKEFLTAAEANGIGSATIELQYLAYHQNRLSNVASIHSDSNGYQQWVNQARLAT